MSAPLTLAQVQYHIDRCDVESLLGFITRCGLREENGHIFVPKDFREPASLTLAINYLVSEFDYSAGEQPETVTVL